MAVSNETVVFTLLGKDKLSGVFQDANKSSKILAGGIALAGAALLKIGSDFDNAYDTIRVSTGATGKTLEGLKSDFKAVVKDVPADFGTASKAIGDLNKRTGLSGKPLQEMSKQFLELSRITGTDVSTNVASVTRVFGDWSIKTGDQSEALDSLFRASQSTGVGVNDLATQIVQFGAPLRQLGFGFEESAALMGKWEKEGVNAGLVLSGLKTGLGNFAKAGEDPAEALKLITERIKNAGSSAEANKIAIEAFGKRAGPDMAAAVREGRFSIEDLLKTVKGGKETILGAADDTKDFGEKLLELKNKVFVELEPIAVAVFDGIGTAVDGVAGAIEALRDAWGDMPEWLQFGIASWAGVTATTLIAVEAFGLAKDAIQAVKGAAETAYLKFLLMGTGAKILTLSLGGIGVLLAAAATAIEIFGGESEEARQRQDQLAAAGRSVADAIREQNGVINESVAQTAAEEAEKAGLLSRLKEMGFSYGTVTDAILEQGGALDEIRGKIQENIEALERRLNVKGGGGQAVRDELEAQKELLGAIDSLVGGKNRELESKKRVTEATKESTVANEKNTTSIEDNIEAMRKATDPVFGLVSALDDVRQAQWAYNKAVKDHGKNSKQARDASINMAKAVAGAEAAAKNGDLSFKDFRSTLRRWRDQGVITATQAKNIEKRVAEARKEAQRFDGKYQADIHANTKPASDKIEALVRKFRSRIINLVPDSSGKVRDVGGAVLRAKGGSIPGWMGTRGRDSVPALLMPDEHVWTTEEVAKFGGHGEMERFRAMVRAGSVPRFAQGGPVTVPVNANLAGTAAKLNAILQAFSGGPTSAGLNGALAWARSQAGKPYIWGGVGPAGYDCSGFMSAITNVIRGKNPYSRLGSTGTFPWGGFSSGVGPFMIGSVRNAGGGIGHMAGTLNGVNVESRGGVGVIIGPSARGARDSLFTGPYALGRYAQGGRVQGDPPFDLLDPRGKYFRLLGSFATGTSYVPKTGAYELHKGEAVIPASKNSAPIQFTNCTFVGGTKRQFTDLLVEGYAEAKRKGRVP